MKPWVVFIGDKPSPRMKKGAEPFQGSKCEKRLNAWIQFLCKDRQYRIYNRVDEAFPIWSLWHHDDGDKIVALGNAASKALKWIPHFKLPHPSGLNRQLNNKSFVLAKLLECKKWLEENK